ncbi:MAG: ABC transporter substrate-binding protein [Candidatus Tectomicrobia bacterium]|nr:ABC transporter substrate-binding protein [Candidatus Tectomicrobia bacterium]
MIVLLASSARASEPRLLVEASVEEVLRIVSNPDLKGLEKAAERRRQLRQAVSRRFDYTEMARRSLATHWSRRSEPERQEFVDLFSKLLESDYAYKIETYSGEKIVVVDQQIDGDYAKVRTAVRLKHEDVAIDYKMLKEDTDWKVYDVMIEGLSLVNNFRSQFNRIILSSSYDELIKTMRVRVADLDALVSPPARNHQGGTPGTP